MKNLFAGMVAVFSSMNGEDSPCPPLAVLRGQMKPADETGLL